MGLSSTWRAERNAQALARLQRSLPEIFPRCVLVHAHTRALTPPTPRLSVDSYWRAHPLRADRLARALAARTGAPAGWTWRGPVFRSPPAPYREKAFGLGRGHCCICGQLVYRYGWHVDVWDDGQPNKNARWHTCCIVAWKLWTAPTEHVKVLRKRQGRTCPATQKRLLRSGEIDHVVPLYKVWRDYRDRPWPELLGYWGVSNLQVINRAGHTEKCVSELRERLAVRGAGPAKSRRNDLRKTDPSASATGEPR